MKTNLLKSGMVLVLFGTAATGLAEETNAWKRIGVSYRAAFNISVDFSGLGGFIPFGNPGGPGRIAGAPGTVVRTYDDGFIGIDLSGNANERTTYWGYNHGPDVMGSQVVGDTVEMRSSSSSATVSTGDVEDEPQHGIELSYLHPLGGGANWHWGLEAAFNWTDISIRDRRTLAGDVVTLAHAFSLGGVLPPVTPPVYVGPVDGPGAPQLSDAATDVSGPPQIGVATISGSRKIAANLYGFRLGPYVEWPLGERCSIALGGGFSFGYVESEFSFDDMVAITGLGSQSRTGSDRGSDWVYGGYVRGQVNVRLCRAGSFFGGLEFNSLSSFTQSAGGAKARVDMSAGVYFTGGLSFSF